MIQCCNACRFFDEPAGVCRRNAPRVAVVRATETGDARSVWPSVHPGDWCGEYQDAWPDQDVRAHGAGGLAP